MVYCPIHLEKRDVTANHKQFVRLYRRNILRVYRSVMSWMRLIENAALYGVEEQMIHGREPILEATVDYEQWKPETRLQKRMMEERAEQLAASFALQKAPFTNIVTKLADWNCIRMQGDKRIGQHHMRIYGDAMSVSGQIARISTPFDVVNRHAVEWATKNTTRIVNELVKDTIRGIGRAISDGIAQGKSTARIGREMRRMKMFGLNDRQTNALLRYKNKLGAAKLDIQSMLSSANGNVAEANRLLRGKYPKAWTKQVKQNAFSIDNRVAREARKKLRYRGEMISRTETSRAVSEGSLDGYKESPANRVRFDASGDACIECSFLDSNVYTLAAASGIIPVHPLCRCSWSPVIG